MRQFALALCILSAVSVVASRGSEAAIALRYRGQPGQVAVYRLSVNATGEQVSLGERRPVRVTAEFELREEVIATGPADSLIVRTQARPLTVRDPSGTFATGERSRFPEIEEVIAPNGELLEASAASDFHIGPYQRAFASLVLGDQPVVLPTGPVSVGEAWQWEKDGNRQSSRFESAEQTAAGTVARIAVTTSSPIRLQEESKSLGLKTNVSGGVTGESRLDLLADKGVVLRHKGRMRFSTKGEASLALSGGVKEFPVRSEMQVEFDLRLTRLNGKAVTTG